MYKDISDMEFVTEMKIFWQNIDDTKRRTFMLMIQDYFDEGDRSERIINKMQEKI